MSLGGGGFGSVPFGSGELSADFGAAINLGDSVQVPYIGPLGGCGSVLDPYAWSVASDCDACAPYVQLVEFSDGFLRFYFDREPKCGCSYTLSDGTSFIEFPGKCAARASVAGEQSADFYLRDIANPAVDRDRLGGSLGTFQVSDDGDLENQGGEASLRKRIIRRCTVIIGEIFSSPEYGTRLDIKKLARPDLLLVTQTKLQAQVLREPEVRGCTVKVSRVRSRPEMVWVSVVAHTGGVAPVSFGFGVGE